MRSALLLTAVAALALAAGCSTSAQPCSVSTCGGCCQQGACVVGTDDALCGAGGFECNNCVGAGLVCKKGICLQAGMPETCTDSKKDGAETDVDCGGASCAPCAKGSSCAVGTDCASGTCTNHHCAEASCTDSTRNGSESDRDCGGGTCPACATGQSCGTDGDCASHGCRGGLCVDLASCHDDKKDGAETDRDCGGPLCPSCLTGRACSAARDCMSGSCVNGLCTAPASCVNNTKDVGETDVDCGGPSCDPCPIGKVCKGHGDCLSQTCIYGVCTLPTCSDAVKNQAEADVDCGGPCPACVNGKHCGGDGDCQSKTCETGSCCGAASKSCAASAECCTGLLCVSGACKSGCLIDSVSYAEGAVNPANVCQQCKHATSDHAWSNLADSTACGSSQYCNGGSCTGCLNGRACKPTNACHTGTEQCVGPASSCVDTGTSVSDGQSCGSGKLCHSGACVAGCQIAGAYYASGAASTADPCQICDPAKSTTAFSAAVTGTACASGKVCSAGACTAACFIGGAIVASGTANPSNACQSCQPAVSTTAYSAKATGQSCGDGKVCSSGACTAGCFIGGVVIASNAVDPGNACRACLPDLSTTAYSNNDGVRCGTSSVCFQASCTPGCYCESVYHSNGTTSPGVVPSGTTSNDGCATCDPVSSVNCLGTPHNQGYRCYFPSGCCGYCSGTSCSFIGCPSAGYCN